MHRVAVVAAGVLAVAAAGLVVPGRATADSVSIGVQTGNMQLGINLGATPPPLVAVPPPVMVAPGPAAPPVYYSPDLPYNYFVYQKVHYLYRDGRWFRARRHTGPWTAVGIAQVPRRVLAVPVEHYRDRPAHWEHHGPPPWQQERGRERVSQPDRGRGHEQQRDHGEGRGHGKDHD